MADHRLGDAKDVARALERLRHAYGGQYVLQHIKEVGANARQLALVDAAKYLLDLADGERKRRGAVARALADAAAVIAAAAQTGSTIGGV